MAESNKKTVMALVKEVTEGTPVKPTAGNQYIALQDGFSIDPAFEELTNEELTGSLGVAKSILGLENPTASLSHYIRHSGIEGQEPNYGLLLEGVFGTKKIVAIERDTVGGSTAGDSVTAAIIKVDTGEGVEFERGQAILIKDGVNGFEIRNVLSVSIDDLTLAFNLANAPASGVNLGKAVFYKPADTHPSMSIWNFRGNGGAIELISGAKITEFSMEVTAGELVNGSFTLDGIEFFFNPIEVDATNNKFDGTDDGGIFTATIPSRTYKDPHDLAAQLSTSFTAASASETWTVTYDNVTGKFTIAATGAVVSLRWDTGASTATSIGPDIGFVIISDDTGSTSYVGDNAIDLSRLQTPIFDDSNPLVAKNNEVFFGDFPDISCFSARTITTVLANTNESLPDVCSQSGQEGKLITERVITTTIVATLPRFEADKFRRFRENDDIQLAYNFGTKVGGGWVAGKSANMFIPTGTISAFKLGDDASIVTLEMTVKAFVKDALNEFYFNFL